MKTKLITLGVNPGDCIKRNRKMTLRVVFLVVLACFMTLALSGCLLNRVVALKGQFCDFESNFSLQLEDSVGFYFNKPVLLDSDILWLSGASPTKISKSADTLTMTFVLEKVMSQPGYQPDPVDDFWVEMHFDRIEDKFKLRRVQIDPKLSTLMSPDFLNDEMMKSAVQDVCNTGLSLASTTLEFDISEQSMNMLPNRREILELLGAPLEQVGHDTGLVYKYRLKGEERESEFFRLSVWFDDSGEIPLRMESQHSRYHTKADFMERKVFFKVSI